MSATGTRHTTAPTRSGRGARNPRAAPAPAGAGAPARGEPLGGRDEVVEHVLLALEHPRLVPRFAVLAAAAEVRHGVDSARAEQHKTGRIEPGRQTDVEAAVAAEEHGPVAVLDDVPAVHEKHRHRRAIPG